MARTPIDLDERVWQFQTPLWQTNCLLAVAGGEALLCDPSYTTEELEELRGEVARRQAEAAHVLVTHADYDHICGLGFFPAGVVVGGAGTAERIGDGSAVAELEAAAVEWGIAWPVAGVRVDRTARPGEELVLGSFRVATVDAPSHGREGLAYVLLDQGVLFAGDHLSPISLPLLAGSLEAAIAANEALLAALDRHRPRWIVPGHGRTLSLEEAHEIGEADLAYLLALRAAAADAVRDELPPGEALLRTFGVEPPREDAEDFAVYGIRAGNARLALDQARA
jgi:glyoxylase-like metal-dependent hydrolase (beta-lactamase superfamily II)